MTSNFFLHSCHVLKKICKAKSVFYAFGRRLRCKKQKRWRRSSQNNNMCSSSLFWWHSLEISRFLYQSDFTWNQFWGFLKCKISHFTTFRGSEFWFFAIFEGWNLPNEQNSQPLKWQKRQICTSRILKIDFT